MKIVTAAERVAIWHLGAYSGDPSGEKITDTGNHYYHATHAWNAQDILDRGSLITHSPSYGTDQNAWPDGTTERRSYWAETPQGASYFYPEGGRPTLLRVPRNIADFKRESTGDIYSRKAIPAKHLEVYVGNDQWVPLQGGDW